MEEKKETHPLGSLYTIGAEGWEPGRKWKKTKHFFPKCEKHLPPPWSKIVKTKFCTWYRVGLDNTLFKPAVGDPWPHFQVYNFYNPAWTAPLGILGDDTEVSPPPVGETCLKEVWTRSLSALLTLPVAQWAQQGGGRSGESFQPPGMLCQEKHSKLSAAKVILTSNFILEGTKGADIWPGDE